MGAFPCLALIVGAVDFETDNGCLKQLAVGIIIVARYICRADTAGSNFILDACRCIPGRKPIGLQVVAQLVDRNLGEFLRTHTAELVLGQLVFFTRGFFGRAAIVVVNGRVQNGFPVGCSCCVETNPAHTCTSRKTAVGAADFGPGITAIHTFPNSRTLSGFHKIPGTALAFPT